MPVELDYILVIAAVACALGYLIWRKVSSVKAIRRDWASGHPENCSGCAVVKIRKAQLMSKHK
jgi:hypothetical protein